MVGSRKVVVEVRSLNSKQLDLSLKVPQILRDKEMEIRQLGSEKIMRGKSEISIVFEGGVEKRATVNQDLAADYFKQIKDLAAKLGVQTDSTDMIGTTLKMPEVLQSERGVIADEEWGRIVEMVKEALAAFNGFRDEEGRKLFDDLQSNIDQVSLLREEVAPYIDGRVDRIRDRIQKNLDQVMEGKDVDGDRLEQEIVFYLEKYDVSEEMTRLKAHCSYFKETMAGDDPLGKKLGFISQEIGREINTLGAKAYDADMQKVVVQMKDSLEKIKEQVLNVL